MTVKSAPDLQYAAGTGDRAPWKTYQLSTLSNVISLPAGFNSGRHCATGWTGCYGQVRAPVIDPKQAVVHRHSKASAGQCWTLPCCRRQIKGFPNGALALQRSATNGGIRYVITGGIYTPGVLPLWYLTVALCAGSIYTTNDRYGQNNRWSIA